MNTRIRLAGAALLAVIVVTATAVADEDIDAQGRPKNYKAGQSRRYAIWHEGDTWHVRTTTGPKDGHTFSGTIQVVDGKMTNLKPVAVEKGGKSKKNLDYGSWNPEGTLFTFSFTTGKGGQDGFDLQVNDKAKSLKFVLKVDGKEVPDDIFVGAKNSHPKSATFSLPAHPGK